MRSVFRKEFSELLLLASLLVVGRVIVGGVLKEEEREASLAVLVTLGIAGWLVGAWQGWLDRRAVRDAFLLHRPISPARIHGARALAGLGVQGVVSLVLLAILLILPWPRDGRLVGGLLGDGDLRWWRDFDLGTGLVAASYGIGVWAAARLGASAARPASACVLAVLLPVTVTMAAYRTATNAAAVAVVLGAGALCAALTLASLALRSTGRRTA